MTTTHLQLFRSVIFAATLAVAASAFGQTPTCAAPGCNSITSDDSQNTATGSFALMNVEEANGGAFNTANGNYALHSNTTGSYNTADGVSALESNTTGSNNTANGYRALYDNAGDRNNAFGEGALFRNTTASDNNAMGTYALRENTTGALNNAVGNFAMEYNTAGNNNNAIGYGGLLRNTTGSDNSAQGYEALGSNTTGNLNIAIGYKAGFDQTSGSQNIYLGNTGVAAESNVIRIGSSSGVSTQSAVFIAGISGNAQTGGTVVVTASGQLGVVCSSRRYKQDIEPLGDASARLYKLRPVKFRYIKPDEQGQKPLQFGLIAEEVADVLPELVYRNAAGKAEGVRYDELTPLLLNEVKQQRKQLQNLTRQLAELKSLVATMSNQSKDERVAMR
jgi:Chaperone of endosialidase